MNVPGGGASNMNVPGVGTSMNVPGGGTSNEGFEPTAVSPNKYAHFSSKTEIS